MPPPMPNDILPVYVQLKTFFFGNDEVCALIDARAELGKERYGTYLQPFNGRPVYDDLLMELLDALMYATQGWMEDVVSIRIIVFLREITLLAISEKKEHDL